MRSPLSLGWCLAVIAALGPVLVALYVELSMREAHQELSGDLAVLELRTLNALEGRQLLGPYSRYPWSHLGPFYFYLLTPLYAASGRAPWSLFVGAGLIHLACLGGFLVVWLRLARGLFARLAVCILTAAFTYHFTLHLYKGYWPVAFVSPWNPIVPITAYGCLFVVGVAAVCGSPRLLPFLVLLHAFVVQTHIGYGVAASVLLLIAGAAAGRRLWRGHGRGALYSALVIMVLSWTPTAVDQVAGTHNLTRLARFFLVSDPINLSPGDALAHVAGRFAEVVLAPLGIADAGSRPWLGLTLFTAQMAALVAGLVRNRGARRSTRWWAPLLALVQTAAVIVSVTRLEDLSHTYLTHWMMLAGTCNWLAVVLAFWPRPRAAPRPLTAAVVLAVAVVLPLSTAARSVEPLIERQRETLALVRDRRPIASLAHELRDPLLDGTVLRTAPEAWATYAGIVTHLYRSGMRPRLDPRWAFMLGDAFEYETDPAWWLELDMGRTVDGDLVYRAGPISVYRRTREDRMLRRWPLPIEVEALGYEGELGYLTDGVVPAEGTTPSPRNAVRLLGVDSAVTIALGPVRRVQTVEIVADGSHAYLLESSRDGVIFRPAGKFAAAFGGLRARQVWFGRGGRGRTTHLRLRPGEGDGQRWLAEVAVAERGGDWSAADDAEAARLAPLFDGVAAPIDDAVPVPRHVVVRPGGSLVLRPPGRPLRRIELWTEPAAIWRVAVKDRTGPWTPLALEPADSVGDGQAVVAAVLDPPRSWFNVRVTHGGERPQALSEVTGVAVGR